MSLAPCVSPHPSLPIPSHVSSYLLSSPFSFLPPYSHSVSRLQHLSSLCLPRLRLPLSVFHYVCPSLSLCFFPSVSCPFCVSLSVLTSVHSMFFVSLYVFPSDSLRLPFVSNPIRYAYMSFPYDLPPLSFPFCLPLYFTNSVCPSLCFFCLLSLPSFY
jgi:hypothetical protein